MLWLTLLQHRYIHIFTCSQIQWLTDSFRFQNRRGKQSIRLAIGCYFSISNHNNTIYIPIKHIFQTMLNNHDCRMIIFLNPVNQINGSFSTGFYQFFCCFSHRHIIIQIGRMHDFINLTFQCLIISWIMITKGINCYPCGKVQIFLSICILQIHTVSRFQNYRKTIIGMQHILFRLFHICIHLFFLFSYSSSSSAIIAVPTPLSVKNSRSRQCSILPSKICTLETPDLIASTQF